MFNFVTPSTNLILLKVNIMLGNTKFKYYTEQSRHGRRLTMRNQRFWRTSEWWDAIQEEFHQKACSECIGMRSTRRGFRL